MTLCETRDPLYSRWNPGTFTSDDSVARLLQKIGETPVKMLISVWLVIAIMIGALPVPVFAVQTDGRDGTSMALHFAPDTLFYLSFPLPKTDLLDRIDEQIMQQLPTTFGAPTTFRALLNESLAPMGTDVDSLFSMLGDYAAVGLGEVDVQTGTSQAITLMIEIADRTEVEALLPQVLGSRFSSQVDGAFTVFGSSSGPEKWAINDDFLIFYSGTDAVPNLAPDPSLAGETQFQAAFAALPEDRYDSAMYADLGTLMALDDLAIPAESGILPDYIGPLAAGITTLPGTDAMVLDSAQFPGALGGPVSTAPIDLDFARHLPENTSLVYHAADLAADYEAWLDRAATFMPGDPTTDIENALTAVGIDFREDILSWVSGDYALFLAIEMMPILRAALDEHIEISENLDFGLVVEATDPDKAQALATTLGGLAQAAPPEQSGVTVTTDSIQDTDVTVLSLTNDISPSDTLTMDIAVGANDDVFFIATRRAAEAILGSGNHLVDNPDYVAARQMFLPDPMFTVYSDAQGVFMPVVTIAGLAWLGPSIGSVFDEIVTELESPQQSAVPEPRFVAAQPVDPSFEEALDVIESILETGGSISVSQTVTPDGISLVRVASSEPQLAMMMSSIGTIGVLALLGPAIGTVYSGLEAEIRATQAASP